MDPEQASASQPHPVRDSDWGFARLPSLDAMFAAVARGQEAPLLGSLRASRTFNSPDCVEAMAEVYAVGHLVDGLKARPACAPLHDGHGHMPSHAFMPHPHSLRQWHCCVFMHVC